MNSKDYLNIPTYDECMSLVESNPDAFITKDENVDGIDVTTFGYRLASYSDFTLNGARNMRGITFRKDTKKLIALPFHKFFNYNENPYTMDESIKNKNIVRITEKYDGSLIYFFIINGKLYAKTKMNCFSEQSEWAMKIVENISLLKKGIIDLINKGFTPMFEFISPRNQIVILYSSEELVYLGARNMNTGEYNFEYKMKDCKNAEYLPFDSIETLNKILKDYYGHEGVVVTFEDGDMVKFKTSEYFNLHKVKENIYNEKAIANLILNEKIDDIKAAFSTSKELVDYIEDMEFKIKKHYFKLINHAQKFYNFNKELDRKNYAINGQKELSKIEFGLAMEFYLNGMYDIEKFKERFIDKKMWEEE
ncbi:MAG: RNA ligase [Candidatus Nanoarchaeia archaeon]|nr:RNA ligase [Candidatus Nanoarchaeia archaeon]